MRSGTTFWQGENEETLVEEKYLWQDRLEVCRHVLDDPSLVFR